MISKIKTPLAAAIALAPRADSHTRVETAFDGDRRLAGTDLQSSQSAGFSASRPALAAPAISLSRVASPSVPLAIMPIRAGFARK